MADFDDIFRALDGLPEAIKKAEKQSLKKSATKVVRKAKGKLGTYQPGIGEFGAWVPLKPETVRRKYLSKSKAWHINDSGQIRINTTAAGKRYLKKHGQWGGGGGDDSPLVDSGALRNAITADFSDIDEGVAYVGVAKGLPEKQAVTMEFGSVKKKIPARPYLRPALFESQDEIKEDFSDTIKEVVQDLWRQGTR